jgi:hypothetical protein
MSPTLAHDKWLDEFFGFLIHELLTLILCPSASLFVIVVVGFLLEKCGLFTSLSFPLFGSLFSPLFWGAGALLGFWFNKRMLHRSACWVWVLPVLAFGMLLIHDVVAKINQYDTATAWKLEYDQFLTCHDECLPAVFFTVPTMNSIAYSISAWLALRSWQTKKRKSP